MKKKKKKNQWEIRKYQGDIALYAFCKCGFYYCCSSSKRKDDGSWSFEQVIDKLYNYCPNCGHKKEFYSITPIKMPQQFPWEE